MQSCTANETVTDCKEARSSGSAVQSDYESPSRSLKNDREKSFSVPRADWIGATCLCSLPSAVPVPNPCPGNPAYGPDSSCAVT